MPWRWGTGSLSGVCLHTYRTPTPPLHTHTHSHSSPSCHLHLCTTSLFWNMYIFFTCGGQAGYTLYIICLYRLGMIYCMNTVQLALGFLFVILIRWGFFFLLLFWRVWPECSKVDVGRVALFPPLRGNSMYDLEMIWLANWGTALFKSCHIWT